MHLTSNISRSLISVCCWQKNKKQKQNWKRKKMKMSEFDLSSNSLLMKQNNMNSDKSKLYKIIFRNTIHKFIFIVGRILEFTSTCANSYNKERMLLSIKGLLSLKKENKLTNVFIVCKDLSKFSSCNFFLFFDIMPRLATVNPCIVMCNSLSE